MIARETLPVPITVSFLAITIVKAKFGPLFGKKAKIVEEALVELQENEQEKVAELQTKLEKEGHAAIIAADGESYGIQSDMVTIAMQTKKTSGNRYSIILHLFFVFSY